LPRTEEIPAGVPSTRGHPLLRVLAGAPSTYDGTFPPDITLLIEVVGKEFGWNKIRGVRHTPSVEANGVSRTRRWFSLTPLVYTWAKGANFLSAPESWPDSIRVALMPNPVSPYEMSFFIGKNARAFSTLPWADCILYSYCAGLSIQEISLMLDLDHQQIILQMEDAVKRYLQDHRFRIWSWGLNWTSVIIPPEVDESLLTRMSIKSILDEGRVFDVDVHSPEYKHLGTIVNSTRMQRYAMYAPKSIRHIPSRWLASGLVRLGTTKQEQQPSGPHTGG
jgi:hypothetical protein